MGDLTLIPVVPNGAHESWAFVDYTDGSGELRKVTVHEYPRERGEALRKHRIEVCGLGRRAAARALGIEVVRLCDLERGSMTLSDEDWVEALARLARASGRKGERG